MNKMCNKCKIEKECNENNFYKAKKSKDGYMNICKFCKSEYDKIYALKNKEKLKVWKANYRAANKDKINKDSKLYRETNKIKIASYNKLYKSIKTNKEKINNTRKQRYKTPNAEERIKLRMKDKENLKIRVQKYKSKKKELLSDLTKQQWEMCKIYFNNQCAYCGSDEDLAQEHFIPLSKGGEFTAKNIIPSCKRCNSSKRDNEFIVWYKNQPYYNKSKATKIINYLSATKA